MPAQSGASGPTTTKSIALARQYAITARMVGQIKRHALGVLRDAGIAGRADEPFGERARRHLPGQRVLAAAGAQQQNVHAPQSSWAAMSWMALA